MKFSSYQPGQVVQRWKNKRFEDYLCTHPQGADMIEQIILALKYETEI
jgi:hypothetical protein